MTTLTNTRPTLKSPRSIFTRNRRPKGTKGGQQGASTGAKDNWAAYGGDYQQAGYGPDKAGWDKKGKAWYDAPVLDSMNLDIVYIPSGAVIEVQNNSCSRIDVLVRQ